MKFAQLSFLAVLLLTVTACHRSRRPRVATYRPSPYGYATYNTLPPNPGPGGQPLPPGYAPPGSYVPPPSYAPPASYAPAAPQFARVTLVGLLIAPGKTDGTHWDLGGEVSSEDMQRLAFKLAAKEPYVGLAMFVASVTMPATAKPDIVGTAALMTSNGAEQPYNLAKIQDSFTPEWNLSWAHVPLDGRARIHVQCLDMDLVNHDPVGTFELGPEAIRAAMRDGGVYPVAVDGQTSNQILFARISAMAE
ncbi:MAG: hypothetical protein K1X42_17665 [Opitutaceae bacterium]|nr:hypothetical protein [Opitutaceae bacterium]